MIAIILATPPRKARAEPVPLRQIAENAGRPSHPCQLPRQRLMIASDAGGRCSLRRQPTRRKCCAMSDLARAVKGAPARGLPQFPVMPDPKSRN